MRQLILLGISILTISFSVKGNIFSKDSLNNQLEYHNQLFDSIKKMESLRSISPNECLEFGKRVIKLTLGTANPSLVGLAEKTQAVSYYYQAVFDTALIHYKKAIPEFEKADQRIDIGKVFNNMAIIYRRTSKSELALENYLEAKKIYEEIGYTTGIASIYMNIGGVYFFLSNYKEAERNSLKALSLFKELGKGSKLVKINMNLGVMYMRKFQYEKAFEYLNRAQILSEEYGVNLRDKGDILLNLGEVAFYKDVFRFRAEFFPFLAHLPLAMAGRLVYLRFGETLEKRFIDTLRID